MRPAITPSLATKISPLAGSYARRKGNSPTGTVATTVLACADGTKKAEARTKTARSTAIPIARRRWRSSLGTSRRRSLDNLDVTPLRDREGRLELQTSKDFVDRLRKENE